MNDRYSRQEAFFGIGQEGQEKLHSSRICIVGLGALGTVTANNLARAGVGFIRIVDRDYVELSNLQRQVIYTERDAAEALPKAEAARRHLQEANSEIEIEAMITDFNSSTADTLISDVDLVLDATDNFETRYLINEACHALKKSWIYGGALGANGMTMNIIYGEDKPCFCCFAGTDSKNTGQSCATAGVLASTTSIVSSYQCAEAIKYLTGNGKLRKTLLYFDLWENQMEEIAVAKDPECPVCVHGQYGYYGKSIGMQAVSLCGRNSVQIIPADPGEVDFDYYAQKLTPLGNVTVNQFTLDFENHDIGIKLFKNGRAIIKNVDDPSRAKSIYTEFIG